MRRRHPLFNFIALITASLILLQPLMGRAIGFDPESLPEASILVRKVDLSGNYPYLAKRLLRRIPLQPGEDFREEDVAESRERLLQFFIKEGFPNSAVDIAVTPDKKKGWMNVRIRIDKGKPLRVGEVTVSGNSHFREASLRGKVTTSRYSITKIKRRLKKITKKYVDRGYVRARARIATPVINPETRKVDFTLSINEHKRLRVRFRGNHWFKPQTLDDYVTFYRERGYDRFSIERSRERLIAFYRVNGFFTTSISQEIEKSEKEVLVTYLIHEGPRTRLKEVRFIGNRHFPEGRLKKEIESREHSLTRLGLFREDFLPIDLGKIADFYKNEGFFDTTVSGSDVTLNSFGDQATVTITLDEGAPYHLGVIDFSGNNRFSDDKLGSEANLKIGKRYRQEKIDKVISRITSLYHTEGYPHAVVRPVNEINREAHTVGLTLAVTEGPRVVIGRIHLVGVYSTREAVIREALKFREGDPYIYKKQLGGQLNLKRLGIFDQVTVTPVGLDEKEEGVDILVRVHERKSLTLDLQAGFDSDKLGSGQFIATQRNILGTGKQLQFRGIGGFEFDRGELSLYSPRIFGASWNLLTLGFVEYQDDENFNASSFGGSVGVIKNFGSRWTVLYKGQVVRFNIFEDQSNKTALERNLFDNTFLELSASTAFDTRDNFADPAKGIYALVTTEFDTDLANARNNFNITRLSGTHFLSFSRFTLSNTFRAGKLFRISNSPQIPANKLFFMGGNDTVRGFDEDSLDRSGGTTSLLYNGELQFALTESIKIAGFFDMGSLTETFDEISSDTFRESAGPGLRYMTPVGPIRLDYGFVLDQRPGEKGHRFHFSFGYFF